MKMNVFFGFLFVVFAVVGCKAGTNNEERTGQAGSIEKDRTELVADSAVSVEQALSVDLNDIIKKKKYTKEITDTLIGGVKFKRYYFNIRTKDLADETLLILPASENSLANKKIIKRLIDDYSIDADSVQDQLEGRFNAYADGNYAEEGDEYHESELSVYPLNVTGGKYVAYMLHSSLFWPSEQNHPQWADVYYMFDLNTGEIITIDDIYAASQEIRQTVGVKIHEELVKLAGNEEDIFAEAGPELLNASFVFDDKGMTFFYQPYEVGPYMLGEPEVFLSKEWLEPYLKKDGVLYEYWFNKR